MKRKMNSSPIFRKFALKLKRERLWNRFRILEYYFHIYTTERNNSICNIYDALKHPRKYDIQNEHLNYGIFGNGKYVPLEKIFEYYSV